MPNLLLQKTFAKIKISSLEKGMKLLEPKELMKLPKGAETIQKHIKSTATISTINEIQKN